MCTNISNNYQVKFLNIYEDLLKQIAKTKIINTRKSIELKSQKYDCIQTSDDSDLSINDCDDIISTLAGPSFYFESGEFEEDDNVAALTTETINLFTSYKLISEQEFLIFINERSLMQVLFLKQNFEDSCDN